MDFKEMTLEDIIWDNSQSPEGRKLLEEKGLYIKGEIYRQLPLGSYGRADLVEVCYYNPIDTVVITVYELKRGCINIDALLQACRYVTALERHGFQDKEWDSTIEHNICLIGDSVEINSDFMFLYNKMDRVRIYTYKYSITGITFEKVGKNWHHIDEVINEETSNTLIDCLEKMFQEE